MSTEYITQTDMMTESFLASAKEIGYDSTGEISGDSIQLLSNQGNYAWVTPVGDRISVARYGRNWIDDLVEHLGLISEYEDEYWEYVDKGDED